MEIRRDAQAGVQKEDVSGETWGARFSLADTAHEHVQIVSCCLVTNENDVSLEYVVVDDDDAVIGQLNISHVTYSSVIRYAVPSPSDVISRTTVYHVPVRCVLPRQSRPISRVDPSVRSAHAMTGDGRFNVRLNLFEDSTFKV